jgi:hypothetical protein
MTTASKKIKARATRLGVFKGPAALSGGILKQAHRDLDAKVNEAEVVEPTEPVANPRSPFQPERTLANVREVEAEDNLGELSHRRHWEAVPIDTICDDLVAHTNGWPKAAGGQLFVEGPDGRPRFLGSPAALFAWAHSQAELDWRRGPRFVTKEELFERLKDVVEHYEGIEMLPHYPTMEGIYYMHPPVPSGNGKALDTFLNYFKPNSEEDRVLMKAAIMTLFWGGPPGDRPAFLVTGPPNDPQRGRGVGKSKFIDIILDELCGGCVDVTQNDTISGIKTRLLSADGRQRRACRLDNVKTHRFSWAELEGLITASTISGKRLYHGEGQRPNTVTWLISINGASLSKDLSQRVIPIELARPVHRSGWEREVRKFARAHRDEIVADILALLKTKTKSSAISSRWADWDARVLARAATSADEVASCMNLISERQNAIDDDEQEKDLVRSYFCNALSAAVGSAPDDRWIFIPVPIVVEWLETSTRKTRPTGQAMTFLENLGIPELRKTKNNGYPGFTWKGMRCKGSRLEKPFEQKGYGRASCKAWGPGIGI